MNELIAAELERRLALWRDIKGEIKKSPEGKVSVDFVWSKYVYRDRKGTYVHGEHTKSLTKTLEKDRRVGVTVSIRLNESRYQYQNKINEDWAQFEYPDTKKKGADRNKVLASMNAKDFGLPVFVVIGEYKRIDGVSAYDRIELGWVHEISETSKTILVKFSEKKPSPEKPVPSELTKLRESEREEFVKVRARPNQPKFSFYVKDYYGEKCAVCDVSHKNLLDAAHIVAKAERGIDSVLNGLVLCKNHHAAFDNYLFGINPESKKLKLLLGEMAQDLNISEQKLKTATGKMPDTKALKWKWGEFQRAMKKAKKKAKK